MSADSDLAACRGEYLALAERNWHAIMLHWRVTKIILAVIVVATLAFGVLSVVLSNQGNDLARKIQASRHALCDDANERNHTTVAVLNRVIVSLPVSQQARAKANEHFTIALINALSPLHDCSKLN